jgi:hypothetical protein
MPERLTWHDAADICALEDGERHLGHVVHDEGWHAYDATKPNSAGNAVRELGRFDTAEDAKAAVELSLHAAPPQSKTYRVGG